MTEVTGLTHASHITTKRADKRKTAPTYDDLPLAVQQKIEEEASFLHACDKVQKSFDTDTRTEALSTVKQYITLKDGLRRHRVLQSIIEKLPVTSARAQGIRSLTQMLPPEHSNLATEDLYKVATTISGHGKSVYDLAHALAALVRTDTSGTLCERIFNKMKGMSPEDAKFFVLEELCNRTSDTGSPYAKNFDAVRQQAESLEDAKKRKRLLETVLYRTLMNMRLSESPKTPPTE